MVVLVLVLGLGFCPRSACCLFACGVGLAYYRWTLPVAANGRKKHGRKTVGHYPAMAPSAARELAKKQAAIGELHKEMYFRWKWVLFPYVSAILFAFALLGIFGSSHFIWLKNLDRFWCYAAIVWGFFLLAMTEQLLEPFRRRTERSTA
jgi:hypothetical protein